MKISITSGRRVSSRFILRKSNQFFSKIGDRGKLVSVIPVEKYGFVVRVKKKEVSFEIYKKAENQEKEICDFLIDTFKNKTVGVKSTEPCSWIKHIEDVRIIDI